MDFIYWLLARCQQAVWGVGELQAAFLSRDIEALNEIDLPQVRRDFVFYSFAMLTGYGPLYPDLT